MVSEEKSTLSASEWDFKKCPESERQICFYYEYFRECKPIRDIVKLSRKKGQSVELGHAVFNVCPPKHDFASGKRICHLLMAFAKLRDFPRRPWLEVSKAERQRIRRELLKGAVTVKHLASEEDIQAINVSPSEGGQFLVEFGSESTPTDVGEAVQKALVVFSKSQPSRLRTQRGRGNHLDRLKELGALRLLEAKAGLGDYSNRQELGRASQKAKQILKDIWPQGL